MAKKSPAALSVWLFVGIGLVIGIGAFLLQALLPNGTRMPQVFVFLSYGWIRTITWLATASHHAPDYFLSVLPLFQGIYWLAIGLLLGLASYGIYLALRWCCDKGRPKGDKSN